MAQEPIVSYANLALFWNGVYFNTHGLLPLDRNFHDVPPAGRCKFYKPVDIDGLDHYFPGTQGDEIQRVWDRHNYCIRHPACVQVYFEVAVELSKRYENVMEILLAAGFYPSDTELWDIHVMQHTIWCHFGLMPGMILKKEEGIEGKYYLHQIVFTHKADTYELINFSGNKVISKGTLALWPVTIHPEL